MSQQADDGRQISAMLDSGDLQTSHPDASLRRLVTDGLRTLAGRADHPVLAILTDGGRPDGLDRRAFGERGNTTVVLLTFGGPGCDKQAIKALDGSELHCHAIDGADPATLTDLLDDLPTGAGS